MTGPVDAVAAGFRERFGRSPDGVWRSPGRVNLIGDHTDHQGGLALPFAIDRHVVVAAAGRDDGVLCVASAQQGGEPVAADVRHRPATHGWADYPLGVGFLLHQDGLATGGADLWIDSTVPVGSGLSSSAALTCATALALLDLAGAPMPRDRIARIAQRAETEVVHAPVGLLDQTTVLFAEPGTALLVDFRQPSPTHIPVPLPAAPWQLAVIDTRVGHSHASSGYADRRAVLERARRALEVASLSELDAATLDGSRATLGAEEYHAARHVITENVRVLDTVEALARHDVGAVGDLMTRSHESLRDDLRVSCPELDLAVLESLDAGAVGARLTGGGFGGSAVVLADATVIADLPARVRTAFRAAGFAPPDVDVVHAVGAAGRASTS